MKNKIMKKCYRCGKPLQEVFKITHYISEEDTELEFCSINCESKFLLSRAVESKKPTQPENQETLF